MPPLPSTSQNSARKREMNRLWPNYNQFWRWSVYISMPIFRPVLRSVLNKMHRNPIVDLFQEVKVALKWGKSTEPDLNVIRSKGKMIHNLTKFQAIPPMHSSNMSTKLKFDLFHWVKEVPKWGKSTDHDQNLISFEGGQDTWAYQLSGHSFHALSRKPQIWPVSLSQSGNKMRKISRLMP